MSKILTVSLGERSYDIAIGAGILKDVGAVLAPVLPAHRVVVVTDNHVAAQYLDTVINSFTAADIECLEPIIVLPGEGSKSFAVYEHVVSELLARKVERSTALVALGGGVVGDLCGFAAATVLRGINFVQIPTTLLAQVDSSVGGKTGINTAQGKNLVGAFYQPRAVIIDTDVLKTLPKRELLAGYAEVVKYGLINRPEFFDFLEEKGTDALSDDVLAYAIEESCRAKAEIVAADEREAGQRALLNLGHTFGHALERLAGYDGTLLHGEAVAIGMVQAFDFSVQLGLCPEEDALRLRRHLEAVGLPVTATGVSPDAILDAMQHDKKVSGGKMTFVLARGIGQAFLSRDIGTGDLQQFLEGALS